MLETKLKSRLSNFELLRIVAMFFIVASHYAYHGIWQIGTVNEGVWKSASVSKKIFTCFLEQGEVGVALFFMLSGFFLINKTRENLRKILIQTVLWSWFSGLISFLILFTIHGGGAAFYRAVLVYS